MATLTNALRASSMQARAAQSPRTSSGRGLAPSLYGSTHFGRVSAFAPRQQQQRRNKVAALCRASGREAPTPSDEVIFQTTVRDIMTPGPLYTCTPETSVEDALEILGNYRLTGMPVVDPETGKLVGVVSDYDLISLEAIIPHKKEANKGGDMFPVAGESWMAFKAVKSMLDTQCAKMVSEVMTPNPITVHPSTSLEDVASLLIKKNIHRLPVMDEDDNMVGIVSRSNIVQAAVKMRKGDL